ncbi:hypothetical protein BGZ65_001095, partial [Modicella reniformis]
MKTTTSGRAFAKNIFDLFSTLMISLPIENHKVFLRNYPNSFTADDAISNLGGLQFIQANHDADPKDPTRIITRVVTTQFSLSRDMAKNLCQTFMDARLFESASDANKREFQNKGIYQVTGKGAHIVEKFVHRNSLSVDDTRHITAKATSRILFLDRTEDEDTIVLNHKTIDNIFMRFAGSQPNDLARLMDSPGEASPLTSNSSRDRVHIDRCNGIEVKDQQHNYDMYKHTFYGKAAVDWLMDYTTVISKEEAINIAQEMVCVRYIEQIGEENRPVGMAAGRFSTDHLLSTQFKLTSNTIPRLPISMAREKHGTMDDSIIDDEPTPINGAMRRLSQILSDPALQILSEAGAMTMYAASSSGKESVGQREGNACAGGGIGSSSLPTTSNTTRLNLILSNSTLREMFKNFLKQNICEENLTFYLEVLDYKSRFNTLINATRAHMSSASGQDLATVAAAGSSPTPTASLRELEKQICTLAFTIHETYLVLGAPRELNLPHQMRQDITTYMQAVVRNMDAPPPSLSSSSSSTSDSSISSSDVQEQGENGGSPNSTMRSKDGLLMGGAGRELIHISLFDSIHEHIFRLMSTDSVPKFTKTDKYREVMMNRCTTETWKKHLDKDSANDYMSMAKIVQFRSQTCTQEDNGKNKLEKCRRSYRASLIRDQRYCSRALRHTKHGNLGGSVL